MLGDKALEVQLFSHKRSRMEVCTYGRSIVVITGVLTPIPQMPTKKGRCRPKLGPCTYMRVPRANACFGQVCRDVSSRAYQPFQKALAM